MIERVVIINDDSSGRGGASAIAVACVRSLRKRGVAVTMISGEAGNDKLASEGADVISLGGKHLLEGQRSSAAVRGLYSTNAQAFLDRWIADNDTPRTIYHLHNWHKVLSPSVFRPLQRVETRLFLSAHDYFLACPNGCFFDYQRSVECGLTAMTLPCLLTNCDKRNYGHKLWRVIRHQVKNRFIQLPRTKATVLAVHESMTPLLLRGGLPKSSIRILRNPATPWTSDRVAAENNNVILYVGRIEIDKGVDILTRVARKVGARLRVIGDGPLRSSLQAQYPEVDFIGHQPRSALSNLVRDARVVVVPTRWPETYGLVSLESLMSGIPVIISDITPFAREIERRNIGFSVDIRDDDELAKRINDLLRDNSLVRRMSEQAHSIVPKLAPSEEEWCENLLKLYNEKLRALEALERNPPSLH